MRIPAVQAAVALGLLLSWPAMASAQQVDDAVPLDEAPPQSEVIINDEEPQQALDEQFHLSAPELSGVIVDRTMTMVGRSFYRTFSQMSLQAGLLDGVVVTIHERPDPRWGSQLWITEGNTVHFRTQLSPRISEADRNAEQAVAAVQESLLRARVSEALQPSRDLADEEL